VAVATGRLWENGAGGCVCTSERRRACGCVLLDCCFGFGLTVPMGLLGGLRDIDMFSICHSKLRAPIKRVIRVDISGVA
jgi:hypothetical protein